MKNKCTPSKNLTKSINYFLPLTAMSVAYYSHILKVMKISFEIGNKIICVCKRNIYHNCFE